MIDSRNLLSGKGKYILGLMLLLFTAVICVAFSVADGDDFDASRREILLRKVGHEILLQSGDNTSRVMPVKKIAENEYQIRFEHELTFKPISLVNITQRLFAKDPVAADYVVNVLVRGSSDIVYGYAMSKSKKDDIVTCGGRTQPRASYLINVKFKPDGISAGKSKYLLGSLPLLAFVGLLFFRSAKPQKTIPDSQYTDLLTLGKVLFDAKNRKLIINENTIDLTGTETRVLRIFALSPNETIERSRIQKEIWEDEGVIVGRSLDMFISKLRKKLELDPDVNITVVRGKGYKLEVSV